jgi:flagellar protein FliS
LYDFCQRKLSEANLNNDIDAINEVSTIVKEIKEGWDNIPEDKRLQSANA